MPPFTDGQNLVESALVWDAHACFPLRADADLSELSRYRASGVNLVSVNVGMDMDATEKLIQVLAGFRKRNIRDDLIKACAGTGSVVGINGVGDFLGGTETETVLHHIEYVIQLVEPAHVGLGLGDVVDKQELLVYFRSETGRFPPQKIKNYLDFVEPQQLAEIAGGLLSRGYTEAGRVGRKLSAGRG